MLLAHRAMTGVIAENLPTLAAVIELRDETLDDHLLHQRH